MTDPDFEQVALQSARTLLAGSSPDNRIPLCPMHQLCEHRSEIRPQYALSVLSAAHADQPIG